MTSMLSDWAREFLREDRVAVVSTLNKDGSPQVTTLWYLLQDDGTFIMSTPGNMTLTVSRWNELRLSSRRGRRW